MDDLEDVWSRLKPRSQDGDTPIGDRLRSQNAGRASRHRQRRRKASSVNRQQSGRRRSARRPLGEHNRSVNSVRSKDTKAEATPVRIRIKGMYKKLRASPRPLLSSIAKKRRIGVGLVVALIVAIAGATYYVASDSDSDSRQEDEPQALGASNQQQAQSPQEEGDVQLPVVEPSFDILVPSNRSIDDLRVVLLSPEGNAPAYTFVDDISGTSIQVTQQQIEDIPNYEGVDAIAADFQATNALRVNDVVVYYGINDRSGVQSVITEKDQILVLILSPRQLSEESWVRYIAALQ